MQQVSLPGQKSFREELTVLIDVRQPGRPIMSAGWHAGAGIMDGKTFKTIRESNGATQESWAAHLNTRFGKKYDKSRVSRWESGAEKIPDELGAALLNARLLDNMRYSRDGNVKVISAVQRKGGVGKSTISSALGFVLSKVKCGDDNARVLVIDGDSQTDLTSLCGISKEQIAEIDAAGRSFYHVLSGKCKPEEAVIPTGMPGLEIIPSSVSLAFAERELILREDHEGISANDSLKKVLTDGFRKRFDFIVIDCAPSLGVTVLNALNASTHALYVVQTETAALAAVENITDIIGVLRKTGHHSLQVLGIVPNMHPKNQKQHNDSLEELKVMATCIRRDRDRIGVPVFTPIPRVTDFTKAAAMRSVLYDIDDAAVGLVTFIEIAAALGVRTLLGE